MNDAVQLPDEHREIFNKMMQEKIQNLDMAKTEALQKEEAEMADTAAIICRALPEYVLTNPASLKIQIPYLHTALSGAVMGYRAQALKQAQAVLKNLPKPQYHTNHRHLRAYEVLLGDPLTPEQPTRPSTPPPTPSRLTAPQSREDNLRFYKQMLEVRPPRQIFLPVLGAVLSCAFCRSMWPKASRTLGTWMLMPSRRPCRAGRPALQRTRISSMRACCTSR